VKPTLRINFEYKFPDLMRVEFKKIWSKKYGEKRPPKILWAAKTPVTLIDAQLAPKYVYGGKVANDYDGHISIRLVKLEPTQFYAATPVEEPSPEVLLELDEEKFGIPLAQGTFEVNMELSAFRDIKKVAKTLSYESSLISSHTRDEIISQRLKKFAESFKSNNPEDKQTKKLLIDIAEQMSGMISTEEVNIGSDEFNPTNIQAALRRIIESTDKDERILRSSQYESMRDKIEPKAPFRRRVPRSFNDEATKQFGEDVFHIFRYYMNIIVRYLKYNFYQSWLKEIPETDAGYFYVHQKVTCKQEGFLALRKREGVMIPSLFLPVNTFLIGDTFSVIKKVDWKKIVSNFASFDIIQEKASENSTTGILSLSFAELVANNFEKAYILAVIALEEAVKQFYEIIENRGSVALKAKWQRKSDKITATIEHLRDNVDYHEFGFPDDLAYKKTMGNILQMIQQRNAIVHRKTPKRYASGQGWYTSLGFSKYVPRTPAERKDLHERICAAIEFSQSLSRYTDPL
jgi:hypothetical protein